MRELVIERYKEAIEIINYYNESWGRTTEPHPNYDKLTDEELLDGFTDVIVLNHQ